MAKKRKGLKEGEEPVDLTEPQPQPEYPNDPMALYELGRPGDVGAETVLKKVVTTPEEPADPP